MMGCASGLEMLKMLTVVLSLKSVHFLKDSLEILVSFLRVFASLREYFVFGCG
jgi:hypothetical protein